MRRWFGGVAPIARTVGTVLCVALALSACGQGDPDAEDSNDAVELTFAISQSNMAAPVLIAQEKGFFATRNIEIVELKQSSGKASLDALLNDEAVMATVADAPIMSASLDRSGYAIVASFIASYANGRLIARRDAGVDTLQDLEGKAVGLTMGTTAEYYLQAQLSHHGFPPGYVERVDIPAREIVDALVSGRVEAISTWQPYIYRATRALGENANLLADYGNYRNTFNLVVRTDRAYPDGALEAVLEALIEAEAYIRDHRSESIDIVSRRLDMDRAYLDSVWDSYEYRVMLDRGLILTLESQARWKLAQLGRRAQEVPDYGQYVDAGPLRAVAPDRVDVD